jgi:PAS domain S-box-containing protein
MKTVTSLISKGSVVLLFMIWVGCFFIGEALVMLLIDALPPLSRWGTALIGSTLLLVPVFPILYLFVFRPLTTHITERKRAEEELRESKALIETVVENVPLMIFLKEATDPRFVICNRAGEELLGYDRKALLGRNNLDLFPPEQAAHFMAKDREVLDEEAGRLDIPEELILTGKKGQRLLHTRKVCIRGADGTTKFLLGISDDITERKPTETYGKMGREICGNQSSASSPH